MLYEVLSTIVHDGTIFSDGSMVKMTEGEALRYTGKLLPVTVKGKPKTMLEAGTPITKKTSSRKIIGFKKRKVK